MIPVGKAVTTFPDRAPTARLFGFPSARDAPRHLRGILAVQNFTILTFCAFALSDDFYC